MFVYKVFLLHSLELLQEFLKMYSLHMFTAREITSTSLVTKTKLQDYSKCLHKKSVD